MPADGRYSVRLRFDSLEDARSWFEDIWDAGLIPSNAGLRHLELTDLPRPLASEVPLIIGAGDDRRRAWVVEPELEARKARPPSNGHSSQDAA